MILRKFQGKEVLFIYFGIFPLVKRFFAVCLFKRTVGYRLQDSGAFIAESFYFAAVFTARRRPYNKWQALFIQPFIFA